jgi:membrane fusion protein, multidrug efflux system
MGGDVPVSIAQASQKNVPVEIQVIGNVEAYSTISVRAVVGGQLTNVNFREGEFVKKGDLLFTIDQRPLKAALDQASANLAQNRAALGQAQANLARDSAQQKYAQAQAARYSQLFQSGVISKDQSEQLSANADAVAQAVNADRASIESAKATIAATSAAMENAKVQLDYTEIRSPIDGRTGNLSVKQGNVVTASSQELVTINQIEPIYVTFSVPEAQLPAIKRYMSGGSLQVRVQPQDDAAAAEDNGTLTFVDNAVDMTTGTIKLKGTFANRDRRLWPGQFVRVTLRLTIQPNAVVVPNQAVQTGQNGSYVYIVKQDRTVESRPVVTGARVEQDMVVDQGVQPGETVVTEGQLRLVPGSRVSVRDASGRGASRGAAEGKSGSQGDGGGKPGAKGRPQT